MTTESRMFEAMRAEGAALLNGQRSPGLERELDDEALRAFATSDEGALNAWHERERARADAFRACLPVGFDCRAWARCGCPQVVVSDRLFASFAATVIPPEIVPEIDVPWPNFVVRIPHGMRTTAHGQYAFISWASLFGEEYVKSPAATAAGLDDLPEGDLRFFGDEGGARTRCLRAHAPRDGLPSSLVNIRELAGGMARGFDDQSNGVLEFLGEADRRQRVRPLPPTGAPREDVIAWAKADLENRPRAPSPPFLLLGRVFANIVIELMSPRHRDAVAKTKTVGLRRNSHGEPKSWTFQLSRDIRVDCREEVKEVLKATSQRAAAKLRLQLLVRGHWRRQPFGPASRERRYQHIEPYWKGQKDAPIAVRKHLLRGDAP
jgi:hypothetical protein